MKTIQPARTYQARLKDRLLLKLDDGKSCFKVYFLDITGRSEPERYEWDAGRRRPEEFLQSLRLAHLEGVGFVIAFPHITKVFRFSPQAEIVLDVLGLNTADLGSTSLERGEGYVEFACLAEALIAADEYRLWAEAQSVQEYLSRYSGFAEAAIVANRKLLAYWGAAP